MSEVACGLIRLSDRRARELAQDVRVAEAFIFRAPLSLAPVARLVKSTGGKPIVFDRGQPAEWRKPNDEIQFGAAWRELHRAITGAAEETTHPLSFLRNGGTPIEGGSLHALPRVYSRVEVEALAEIWKGTDWAEVLRGMDDALLKSDILRLGKFLFEARQRGFAILIYHFWRGEDGSPDERRTQDKLGNQVRWMPWQALSLALVSASVSRLVNPEIRESTERRLVCRVNLYRSYLLASLEADAKEVHLSQQADHWPIDFLRPDDAFKRARAKLHETLLDTDQMTVTLSLEESELLWREIGPAIGKRCYAEITCEQCQRTYGPAEMVPHREVMHDRYGWVMGGTDTIQCPQGHELTMVSNRMS